jgi:ribosome-binding protein aMBF1 (putative translation factor)
MKREKINLGERLGVAGNPGREQRVEEESIRLDIAQALYRLRSEAGLTQAQLAERIGTTQSAIARLEDTDYEGHSLAVLRRVARALGKRLVLSFEPIVTVDRDLDPSVTPPEPAAVA